MPAVFVPTLDPASHITFSVRYGRAATIATQNAVLPTRTDSTLTALAPK